MTYHGRIPIVPRAAANGSIWNFDSVLEALLDIYDGTTPLEIDFRQLVPFGSGIDRATHLVHSYPAKLIANIPIFFTNCSSLTPRDGAIYDPFCGSGTVLVEGALAKLRIFGADANPLARLITSAKTTAIETKRLRAGLSRILRRYPGMRPRRFDPVIDPHKWFDTKTERKLGRLIAAIDEEKGADERDFFRVCFSQCVKKVSRADPRMSVPVLRQNSAFSSDVSGNLISLFSRTVEANTARLARLPPGTRPRFIGDDARTTLPHDFAKGGVDLIVTSPPYAGAQKYIRASSLSIGWLQLAPDLRLRSLESKNIGREHLTQSERAQPHEPLENEISKLLARIREVNPLRADIFVTYLAEMRAAANAIAGSLKAGGHAVLVMGDNQICQIPVSTSRYVRDLFEEAGLSLRLELVDTIKSRGLMTKRNKTAGLITREHVFLFSK